MEQPTQEAADSSRQGLAWSQWLLFAFTFAIPLMKPAVRYPVIIADLIFVLILIAVGIRVASGKSQLRWHRSFTILALYWAALAASFLVSPDKAATLFKLATQLYLVSIAAVVRVLVASERDLKWLLRAWLAASAVVAAVAILALAAFPFVPESALFNYARFHFGTLPPGNYPRVSASFFNANLLCNYLTVSIGLAVVGYCLGWLRRSVLLVLLAAMTVTAAFTLSPGLGGIALALAMAIWVLVGGRRPRLARAAVWSGVAVAGLFLLVTAVTPIVHETAPFLIPVPGTEWVLAPSGRFLVWTAAWEELAKHPLLGHGLGIDAVEVRYLSPSGDHQLLTDAHNLFLSIAAQCGLVGLTGLFLLIGYVLYLTFPRGIASRWKSARLVIGLSFLNAFIYQGVSGSFEDARHLWLLLGLLLAVSRIAEDQELVRRA